MFLTLLYRDPRSWITADYTRFFMHKIDVFTYFSDQRTTIYESLFIKSLSCSQVLRGHLKCEQSRNVKFEIGNSKLRSEADHISWIAGWQLNRGTVRFCCLAIYLEWKWGNMSKCHWTRSKYYGTKKNWVCQHCRIVRYLIVPRLEEQFRLTLPMRWLKYSPRIDFCAAYCHICKDLNLT